MSGLACPHCGGKIDLFGSGGGERTAAEMGVRFLGKIPIDPHLVACGDSGRCFQEAYAGSPVTHAFDAIAEALAGLNAAR
jgi:hypothetical protein